MIVKCPQCRRTTDIERFDYLQGMRIYCSHREGVETWYEMAPAAVEAFLEEAKDASILPEV